MDRRKFLKSLFVLPLIGFAGPSRQAAPEAAPLILLDTAVAGFRYYRGEKVWRSLSAGEPLRLVREPGNVHDERAVEVLHGKDKLGYIPRADNAAIAQLLDRGATLRARITWLKKSLYPWERVGVQVELIRIQRSLKKVGLPGLLCINQVDFGSLIKDVMTLSMRYS